MRNSVFALFSLFGLPVLVFSGMSFMGHPLAFAAPALTHPFPLNFEWCVATAAHQIEGGNTRSDWWDWEKIPGNIKHGDTAAVATDSWHHMDRDIEMLRELHVTTYRFSVEWAKIEPLRGQIDPEAVLHYRLFVEKLRQAKIQPMITLQHFTLPQWFRALGGWEWEGAPEAFEAYTQVVQRQIAPDARYWVTINEPMVHLLGGYFLGNVPPQEKRKLKHVIPVMVGLLKAHARAYHALHHEAENRTHPLQIQVGMANHLRYFQAAKRFNPLDQFFAREFDLLWNWALPDSLRTGKLTLNVPALVHADIAISGLQGSYDFFGINYYTRDRTSSSLILKELFRSANTPPSAEAQALYSPENWESHPEGLEKLLLKTAHRFPGTPIFITENGIADAKDLKRPGYLRDHLLAIQRVVQNGAPVQGYCHWSLLDNFEWIHGYGPKFGLFEVNFNTQMTTPRMSARQFSKYAIQNGID